MNPIKTTSMLRTIRSAALAVGLLSIISTGLAATVLIDFGSETNQTTVDTLSRQWNNVTQNMASGTTFGLVDTTNAATGITFTLTAAFNIGDFNSNGATDSSLYPGSSTGDSLFGNVALFGGESNVVPVLTLSGLDVSKTYSFTFFASRSATDNRIAKYTATGATTSSVFLDADAAGTHTVTLSGMAPSVSGSISISVNHSTVAESGLPTLGAGDNATGFAYLGVLEVTAIPEPSTTAAIMAGSVLVGVIVLRKRRTT